MDVSIRPYSSEDREAVVALSLRAWEPVHSSLARVLAETLHGRLVGDRRATQSRDVRADLDAEDVGVRVAVVETGGDPGHAPARATYAKAGFTSLPIVRYFKDL